MAVKQPHQRTIVNRALKNAFVSSFVFFKFDKRRYPIDSTLSFDLAFPQRVFIYSPKISLFRSSHRRCFWEFHKIHRKTHVLQSPATLLKKRLWHRCFPVNSAKFLRAPFLQNTSGQLLLFIINDDSLQFLE